jgi:putative membrane protein
MKKIKNIKTTLIKTAFIATVLVFTITACDSKKPEDTKQVAEEHNDAKFNTANKEKDAQFLVNAAEFNLEEIQLSQLAQQNAKVPETKELSKMMEVAHQKSQNELTELAKKKLVTLPTAPTDKAKDAYKKLSNKSISNFDVSYCDMLVNAHKDAVVLFEKTSLESTDADIKQWAAATLPELRMHLDKAINCQKICEKKSMK